MSLAVLSSSWLGNTEAIALKILLLEDGEAGADPVLLELGRAGLEADITRADSRESFFSALDAGSHDLVLTPARLPGLSAAEAVVAAQRLCPDTPVIAVVSETIGDDAIDELQKVGVTDVVWRHRLSRLIPAIRRAVRAAEEHRARRTAEASLAESLRITRSIIDATPALVYIYDRTQSRNLFVNEEARRLGYTADELRRMEPDFIDRLMHPNDVEATRRTRETLASLTEGEALELEFRLRSASGEWRWFRAREVRFAGDEASGIEQVLGTAQDVTATKRMEARRAAQFAVTRTLSESASWGEVVRPVLETVRGSSDARVSELWLEDEASGGLRFFAASHADAALAERWETASRSLAFARHEGVISFVRETRRSFLGEAPADALAGRAALLSATAPISMVAVPVRSGTRTAGVLSLLGLEPGAEEHLLALLEGVGSQLGDFRERRLAEERAREQAALLDLAREAIIVVGLDRRVRYWNKGAELLYGHEAAQAVGEDAGRLFGGDEAELRDAWERVHELGEWTGLLEQSGRTGRAMKVQNHWTLVRKGDAPQSVLIMSSDVTEQKRLELELLRAQRLDSLGVLAGGIAHDLNNVLAPILMALDALKKRATDERSIRMFQLLEASASRGADMVRQILGFARGSEGRRLVLEPHAIADEIGKMVREALPTSIHFSIDVPRGLWSVTGDPTQLYQVLLNLCMNARDVMPDGGRLAISARNVELDGPVVGVAGGGRSGPYVVFTVTDTGPGIAPEVMERIFEPFFTTKAEGRGTGLGLSTAMTIVKGHDGFIAVTSELGHGSSFDVYLPAAKSTSRGASAERSIDLPRGHGEVVLVADDEVSIREIAKEALEAFGYVPLLAVDGREAVDICASGRGVAAVLMDVRMPVMDGPTAIRIIQRAEPAIKVIAVSGFLDRQQQALSAGACLFLAKPYTAAQLLTALRAALGHEAP